MKKSYPLNIVASRVPAGALAGMTGKALARVQWDGLNELYDKGITPTSEDRIMSAVFTALGETDKLNRVIRIHDLVSELLELATDELQYMPDPYAGRLDPDFGKSTTAEEN